MEIVLIDNGLIHWPSQVNTSRLSSCHRCHSQATTTDESSAPIQHPITGRHPLPADRDASCPYVLVELSRKKKTIPIPKLESNS